MHFWGALQSANVVDGSLARFIITETEEDYPEEVEGRGIREAPPALVEQLKLVAAGGGHAPSGNLAGLGAGLATSRRSDGRADGAGAREAFRALGAEVTRRLREARGTTHTAILARIGENAAKLALVVAVGRDPVAPRIELGDAEWAIGFVLHFAMRTMRAVEHHVADNETERNHKRVLEIVRRAGSGGLTKTDLSRRSQFLDKRAARGHPDTLSESA